MLCDRTVGLHRIGVVLSLAIIAIAVIVLYRILRNIDVHEVVEALKSAKWRDIALAAACVAGGYFTLTFYDLFALRTIGRRDVPYRIAALAGFTSYSVGHNVGASVFTGGAVRYRVYSAWGVSAIDVAKICFVAGLTFWLGQCHRAGPRHRLCAAGRFRDQPVAGLVQPRRCDPHPCHPRALRGLGLAASRGPSAATAGASPCRAGH